MAVSVVTDAGAGTVGGRRRRRRVPRHRRVSRPPAHADPDDDEGGTQDAAREAGGGRARLLRRPGDARRVPEAPGRDHREAAGVRAGAWPGSPTRSANIAVGPVQGQPARRPQRPVHRPGRPAGAAAGCRGRRLPGLARRRRTCASTARPRTSPRSSRALLDAELEIQAKQLAELDKQKREAEKALASVGGMVTAGYSGPVPGAQPAPRNADGSFPGRSARINDPTGTGGCLTPRMYHTLNEARLAGFTALLACWRTATGASIRRVGPVTSRPIRVGFGGAAARATTRTTATGWPPGPCRTPNALGVLYVIWYQTDLDARYRAGARTPATATRPPSTRTTCTYPCL